MTTKILIADDDFDNRTIAQQTLEAAGFQVRLATNGEEALEQISREIPDVLLLDLSMPKVNGWEVARRIRQTPSMTGIAVIAFTAHALVGEELKAKAAGCDDYFTKPCRPADLLQKVASWIGRKESTKRPGP